LSFLTRIRRVCKQHGLLSQPSTGFVTIIYALDVFKEDNIHLLGVSHQLDNDVHFYDNEYSSDLHDFLKEKEIIEILTRSHFPH
jgi:hypothetical protein